MFAILIRERGIPVAGPIEYPSTQSVLEALKRGDIDIYPDYNGTGLVMIGQNPLADGDAATARVQELYRSEEHTSELQSLMRISYAVFCLTKKKTEIETTILQLKQ